MRSEPLTVARIADLSIQHPELPHDVSHAPSAEAIARGELGIETLRCGVKVMSGRLRGLRRTVTRSASAPGLYVEVRLKGRSEASAEGFPKLSIDAGMLHVLGLPKETSWQAIVPDQPMLEVVSIRFPPAFVESLADADPATAKRLSEAIAARCCRLLELPRAAAVAAEEILLAMSAGTPDKLRLESHALALLAVSLDAVGMASRGDGGLGARIAARIDQAAPRLMTLEQLAEDLGMSLSTLKRAARRDLGCSLGAFLKEHRLAQAERLLAGQLSIADISRSVGYATPEAFAKAYRRRFGEPPSVARRRVRSELV